MAQSIHSDTRETPKNATALPLVSVLMATYNRRNRLEQAIESVRMQTYPHWELCLVCDGGKPVDDIVKKFNDPRIVFQHNIQNRGYGHTANTAFSLSKGKYIAYLGDDDIWMPDHIESLMIALLEQKQVGFAYSNSLCIRRRKNENGDLVPLGEYIPCQGHVNIANILEVNQITGISALHERELFEKAGCFDVKLRCLIDFDLWRRILCFTNTAYVDKVTSLYYEDLECSNDHLTNLATQNPLRYKLQQLRIYNKKLPNGMEERFKHSLKYLRQKHFLVYATASRNAAQEQGDIKKAQKFSKILRKNSCFIPAGKHVDLALFLVQDGENQVALHIFKQHLGASQNGPGVYFLALECAILCKDIWAYEVYEALWQSRDKLRTEDKQRLESLALQLRQEVKIAADIVK